MKKRFFGILLMGAMVIASMSMFTSCKDYDDDINNLQKQIDGITAQNLQSQLTTLQTALSAAQNAASTAQSAADAAAKAAQAAQGTADAANTAAKAAQTAADAAAKAQDVKDLQSAIDDLKKIVDGKVSSEDLANAVKDLEAKIAAVNEGLLTLDDVTKLLADQGFASDAVVKDLNSQIAALKAYKAALEKAGITEASVADQIAKINAAITTLNALTAEGGDIAAIKELANKASETANGVTDKINLLNVLVDKMLNSLVTIPNFYYAGIEAIEAPMLSYSALKYTSDYTTALNQKFEDKTGKKYADALKGAADWKKELEFDKKAGNTARNLAGDAKKYTVDYIPGVIAEYHVNPATLKTEDIEKVAIVSADKEYLTRAAACKPTAKSFDVANGVMNVAIDLDWNKIADQKVTVLAAQATGTKKDTEGNSRVVTSDYAAVVKSFISNLVIADNAADANAAWNKQANLYWNAYDCAYPNNAKPQAAHVYTTINKAISEAPTHSIYWNSEAIDLNDIVEVHAKRLVIADGKTIADYDNAAKEFDFTEQLEKYGLQLQYTLISYIDGQEQTEQTITHATLDGSMFKPKSIKEDGSQNKSAIGRKPLVRIELIDTNNNNALVAVGYIKFYISATQVVDTEIEIPVASTTAYKICDGFSGTTSWDDIEGKILANDQLAADGISKTLFEATYAFAIYDGATKYKTSAKKISAHADEDIATFIKKGDAFVLANNAYKKAITFGKTDQAEQQTNVLKLNISYALAQYILAEKNPDFGVDGKTTKDKEFLNTEGQAVANIADAKINETATITLAAKLMGADGYPNAYVTWDVTVNQLMLSINKIPEYWYASNTEEAKTGVAEIHVNVNPVGQAGANIKYFRGDFRKTIVGTPVDEEIQLAKKNSDTQKGLIIADGLTIDNDTRAKFYNKLKVDLSFVPGTDVAKTKEVGEVVTGGSGKKYFLYPSADGKKLYAAAYKASDKSITKDETNGLIAEIIDDNGKYVFALNGNGVADITAAKYDIVKDVLNYNGAKSLANTLTAHVKATVTEKNRQCENPIILTNPLFDVKFLRPLNASGNASKKFTDAIDNGNILYLKDLASFSDWRAQWTSPTYYTYYEVNVMKALVDDITTTLNNGTLGSTKLIDVAPNTKFEWYTWGASVAGSLNGMNLKDANNKVIYDRSKSSIGYQAAVPATATTAGTPEVPGIDFGCLYYPNIDVNVGNFSIQVPLEIGYHWGTLRGTNVTIDIEYTVKNGAREK